MSRLSRIPADVFTRGTGGPKGSKAVSRSPLVNQSNLLGVLFDTLTVACPVRIVLANFIESTMMPHSSGSFAGVHPAMPEEETPSHQTHPRPDVTHVPSARSSQVRRQGY